MLKSANRSSDDIDGQSRRARIGIDVMLTGNPRYGCAGRQRLLDDRALEG